MTFIYSTFFLYFDDENRGNVPPLNSVAVNQLIINFSMNLEIVLALNN